MRACSRRFDVLVVANLDPHNTQEGTLKLDGKALGIADGKKYVVRDLISGKTYDWNGLSNYVKLDPSVQPVHVFRVEVQ